MPRSTIEFNDAADAQLLDLVKTTNATSKAEVVRNALSLYFYLNSLLAQDNKGLAIIDESQGNRVEKIILVPGLQKKTTIMA
jgi:hypothetical protein